VRSPNAVENRLIDAQLEDELRPNNRRGKTKHGGRRAVKTKATAEHTRGRYTRAVSYRNASARIAIDATLRALAMSLRDRATSVDPRALRYKFLKHKRGTLFIFAIDTSGSMAANRIARAKSTILKLLRKSYLNRDSVAIISFHGTSASVDLAPSRSILRARRVLDSLPMGGSTPLSAGLATTLQLIKQDGDRYGQTAVLLFTDGRSNVPLRRRNNIRALRQQTIEGELRELDLALRKVRSHVVVVDTQRRFESSEETRRLAEILHGRFVKIDPNLGLDV
jgi:magnesium chelatase subunit D